MESRKNLRSESVNVKPRYFIIVYSAQVSLDGLSTKIGDIKRDNEKLASRLNGELERLKAGKKTLLEQLSKYDVYSYSE